VKKRTRKSIVLFAIVFAIILAAGAFIQFVPIGYCMSIRFRNFTEPEHNLFINNSYSYVAVNESGGFITKDDIPVIVDEAKSRVAGLFGGELLSNPVIIISDDESTFNKTGEAITWTIALHKVFNFISISNNRLSVNIMAHEITHAELAYRVLIGKPFRTIDSFLPIWFNEGLSLIPDDRVMFDRETWEKRTDNGAKIDIDVTKLTRADFQGDNGFITQEYALFARNEVLSWLNESSEDSIMRLIDSVRTGKDFQEIYSIGI